MKMTLVFASALLLTGFADAGRVTMQSQSSFAEIVPPAG